jgi:hypothetical protein
MWRVFDNYIGVDVSETRRVCAFTGIVRGDLIMAVQTKPQIVIPTEVEAIATANRWLHQEIGMALHVTSATFDPVSTYWRLPVEMAYPDKGTLGVIGDLFLHAMTGTFGGSPDPNEFRRRADTLATLYGIE